MEQRRVHVIIAGRVQGVYYRASTQEQAQSLGVTGWVRNLPNGDVEFEAQGSKAQLDTLIEWARRGPPRAQVTQLHCKDCEPHAGETDFAVRR